MSEEKDLVLLRALNARFIHNYITNDVRSHDEIIHPRFSLISALGSHQGREQYLEDWATGFDPDVVTYFDMRDERIDIYDSVALVRATTKHTVVIENEPSTGMTVYTDTYVRDDATWRCVQAQLTPIAPEHYPSDDTIVVSYVRGEVQS